MCRDRGRAGRIGRLIPGPREVEADSQRLIHDARQQGGGPLQAEGHHVPLELAQLRPAGKLVFHLSEARTRSW